MSAVVQSARDVGPIQERYTTMSWNIGDASGDIELKVRYRINYPNLRHRGLGLDPDVQVLVVYERGELGEWRIKTLSSQQWAAVVAEIEVDELPTD